LVELVDFGLNIKTTFEKEHNQVFAVRKANTKPCY